MGNSSSGAAPQTGEPIELLIDGQWVEARWGRDGSIGWSSWIDSSSNPILETISGWRPLISPSYGEATELPGHSKRQPIVVVGLGFGDESKGATVDYLSSLIPDTIATVRWSGGGNAAHNVRHGARHHTFRLFGSGSLLGIQSYLTEKVVLNFPLLLGEAEELSESGVHNPLSLIVLHGDSPVTTPIHMALNRAREILRGSGRHGSTGLGVGETVVHSFAESHGLKEGELVGNFELPGPLAMGRGLLTAGMLQGEGPDHEARIQSVLRKQAAYAEPLIRQAVDFMPELAEELWYGSLSAMAQELIGIANLVDIFPRIAFERELERTMEQGTVIFEGSQGLLLDGEWGFHPHTTWARTEPSELVQWLRSLNHRPYVLGLTRSYMTRHGAGPLPSELAQTLEQSELPADDNSWGRWQGDLRVAPLDLPLLRFAIRSILHQSGVELDGIGLSHLDAFGEMTPVVTAYGGVPEPSASIHFMATVENGFPLRATDDFYRAHIEHEQPLLKDFSTEKLPDQLSHLLRIPVVLTASGPQRGDRSIRRDHREN